VVEGAVERRVLKLVLCVDWELLLQQQEEEEEEKASKS